MTEDEMSATEIRKACMAWRKIKKIAQNHYNERYDTDWDSMQSALYKIWKLTK